MVAGRVGDHGEVAPSRRVDAGLAKAGKDTGMFFPREVVAALDLGDVDYHTLRRMLRLVREHSGRPRPPDRKWSRYSLADVAALEVVIEVCGGRGALANGRHLKLASVDRACKALRAQGVAEPLLDTRLRAQGRTVLAIVDGDMVDPTTGQAALAMGHQALTEFLKVRPKDPKTTKSLRDERRRPRPKPAGVQTELPL